MTIRKGWEPIEFVHEDAEGMFAVQSYGPDCWTICDTDKPEYYPTLEEAMVVAEGYVAEQKREPEAPV